MKLNYERDMRITLKEIEWIINSEKDSMNSFFNEWTKVKEWMSFDFEMNNFWIGMSNCNKNELRN